MVYSGTSYYCTSGENDKSVFIEVFENTSINKEIPRNEGNRLYAKNIEWGYPVPKDTEVIARVKRGADGIIHIEAECQSKKVFFEIKPDQALSEFEMQQLKEELKRIQLN